MSITTGITADFALGGGWGDHINLLSPDKFDVRKINRVYGHKSTIPKVGDTLVGEFVRSWIKFEFVKVERPGDPPDMFFADVSVIGQVLKE